MAFEQNELTGSLFENNNKTSNNQPDLRGSCKIGGQEYWISGWGKKASSGTEYLSLAFTNKETGEVAGKTNWTKPVTTKTKPAPNKMTDGEAEELDESIPF